MILTLKYNDKISVIRGFEKRYELYDLNKNLIKELNWLKDVNNLLNIKQDEFKNKLSGYILKSIIDSLNKFIEKLEIIKVKESTL